MWKYIAQRQINLHPSLGPLSFFIADHEPLNHAWHFRFAGSDLWSGHLCMIVFTLPRGENVVVVVVVACMVACQVFVALIVACVLLRFAEKDSLRSWMTFPPTNMEVENDPLETKIILQDVLHFHVCFREGSTYKNRFLVSSASAGCELVSPAEFG